MDSSIVNAGGSQENRMSKSDFFAMISSSKREDDFVNATAWCQKFGKLWGQFYRLPSYQKYFTAVAQRLNVRKSHIIESRKGKGSQTFVHPLVFLELIRWLDVDTAVFANEVFHQYIEGNADLGLDIMLRDHNKGRVERAKSRLRVVDANKQVADLAVKTGVRPDQVHNDRYRGLYHKTCGQLREEASQVASRLGSEPLRADETPLNLMSSYDLALNELANMMALRSADPNAIFSCSSDLRDVHERRVGTPLAPEWKDNRMQPQKARRVLVENQLEFPT